IFTIQEIFHSWFPYHPIVSIQTNHARNITGLHVQIQKLNHQNPALILVDGDIKRNNLCIGTNTRRP
ncbi:hypothetical protein NP199_24630, partial [Salmonella enterica]|nr:hypothetical protein [Salmonella enterica]